MKTALEALTEIQEAAAQTVVRDVRMIELRDGLLFEPKTQKSGRAVRQGDIYIHLVEASHRCGKKAENRQLAFGFSKGSRHVALEPAMVYDGESLPKWCDVRTFLGPVVKSDARFTITHPEHAHVSLPPGVYQVTHQRDARTEERVID